MDLGLQGKCVIVTGATANIGRAIALDFATERAHLIFVGRDEFERSIARPEEVSAAAVFLASDRASFITGQILHVDDGALM